MQCPTDDTILRFFEHVLPPAMGAEVEQHMVGCADCRRLFSLIAQAFHEGHHVEVFGTHTPPVDQERLAQDLLGNDVTRNLRPIPLSLDAIPTESGDRKAPSSPVLPPGSTVDHFQVIRLLGRGGMGEVYLARDTRLGRKVALKMVLPSVLGSKEAKERFLFEARTTASFNHPHIVTVYEVGEDRGRPFVALEYLRGETLRRRIEREALSLNEALRVGLAIAEALSAAHERGVLHRDLKPDNVILPRDGRLRVVDFGLATVFDRRRLDTIDNDEPGAAISLRIALDSAAGHSHVTDDSPVPAICGSPAYMSPEQWRDHEVTGATDAWAFGVILFQMLTGKLPFRADSLRELSHKICDSSSAPTLEEYVALPETVSSLVAACLAKQAARRPSARELTERLTGLLAWDPEQPIVETGPFRGLLPFEEAHRHLFFGRDGEVGGFVERLRERPVMPVVGASGAGKSSFVQAGVIPRLRERGPLIVLRLRPGHRPFAALAARLVEADSRSNSPFGHLGSDERRRAPHERPSTSSVDEESAAERTESTWSLARRLYDSPTLLNLLLQRLAERRQCGVLLYVDQLEELYTLLADREVQARFMQAVCTAADDSQLPVRVILTMREEFLSRIADSSEVRESLGYITVLRSPGPALLRQMLTRPVQAAGYQFEPEMVQEMVDAVSGESACLPLLQFTGQLLWEHRDEEARLLRRASYEHLGGVAGALAAHADGVVAKLSPAERTVARQIFLRLITDEGTRRVIGRGRLTDEVGEGADAVLMQLVEARLVSVRQSLEGEEPQLELVHESLVARWAMLQRWIDQSREELTMLRELEQAAELWERRGRRDDEVWQGEALSEALRVLGRTSARVAARVSEFIAAGSRRAERRIRLKRQRQWLVVGTLTAVAIIATVVSVIVLSQKQVAEAQRAEAQREAARAAERGDDLLEARAKLRAAMETKDSALGRMLWWRLKREPELWHRRFGAGLQKVALSPDQRLVAVASSDKVVYVLDATSRKLVAILRGHRDQILSVAFTPDGKAVLSGGWDGEVRLFGLGQPGERRVIGHHTGAVWELRVTADGRRAITAGADGVIKIWDLATQGRPGITLHQGFRLYTVDVNRQGTLLAAAGVGAGVQLWDLPTLTRRVVLGPQPAEVHAVAFAPDGRTLAASGDDGVVRIFDVAKAQLRRELRGHTQSVWQLSYSGDGARLASGAMDATVRVWNPESGQSVLALRKHRQMITGLSLSRDGQTLFSASNDGTLRCFRVGDGAVSERRQGHGGMVVGLAFSPDGKLLVSGGEDHRIILWDVDSGRELRSLEGHTGKVFSVDFHPRLRRIASGGVGGEIRFWDPDRGILVRVLQGHLGKILELGYSPDGQTLASAGEDGLVRLWHTESGTLVGVLSGHEGSVHGLAFSADGSLLASAGKDRTIRVWSTATGEQLRVIRGHDSEVWGVTFSPDGKRLASGSSDGTLRQWTPAGEQLALLRPAAGGRVYWPAFSPSGELLGLPGSDGKGRLLDLKSGKLIELIGHRAEVNRIKFSRATGLVATCSDDGTVRVFRVSDGTPVWHTAGSTVKRDGKITLYTARGWFSVDGQPAEAFDPGARLAGGESELVRINQRNAARGATCALERSGRLLLSRDGAALQPLASGVAADATLLALDQSCLLLSGGRVALHRPGRPVITYPLTGVQTIATVDGSQVVVATSDAVTELALDGNVGRRYPVDVGVTALFASPVQILVGYSDGNVERIDRHSGRRSSDIALESAPSSPVQVLTPGPMGTLAVGFADGAFGIWDERTGNRLRRTRLHGPLIELRLEQDHLIAVSELGGVRQWDLRPLTQPYCDVMREIWQRVLVVFRQGRAEVTRPPADHGCLR